MGGIDYVYWPGTTTRLTPWMLYCLERLDADLQRLFGVRLSLDSSVTQRGIRTADEQRALFLSRYRLQASGSGPFGDVRFWQGRRYVRHSGLGTVAQPGSSNHEIQGTQAAVDLADSGGAGIGTMGSARSNWLRANAAHYGLVPEGFGFGEAWHYAIPNIFQKAPATAGGGSTSWEDIMAKLDDDDRAWLDAQFTNLRKIIIAPDTNYGAAQAVLSEIQILSPLVKDTQLRVRGGSPRGDMLQLIMEKLGQPITADVDEAALAKELAPLLPAHVGAVTDSDLSRIAKAVADEQAKRLAS